MALGIGQLAAEDRPDLVDRVGELIAPVLDMDGGVAVPSFEEFCGVAYASANA